MTTAAHAARITLLTVASCFWGPGASAAKHLSDAAPPAAGPVGPVRAVRAVPFSEAVQRAMAFHVAANVSLEDVARAQAATTSARAASSPNVFLQAT